MTKQEFIEKAPELLKGYESFGEEIFDDGNDSGDVEANILFSNSVEKIEKMRKELACIDIDGIDTCELDSMWRKSWGDEYDHHLPEAQINHSIRYINAILNVINNENN
ncbi:MAG: hypothetical protein Q4A15_05305 [Prevotellaceae bacterium]|nr:hypothetical protein [Prevotellaceae bacterium]